MNKKNDGDNPLSPSFEHGDNHGDNHPNSQVITPTLDSESESVSTGGKQTMPPGLDWQLAQAARGKRHKIEGITPEQEIQAAIDLSVFALVQKGGGHLGDLHRAFMESRHIIPSDKNLKSWRTAYQAMYDAKPHRVTPDALAEAVRKMVAWKPEICTDPFKVMEQAIGIANPAPGAGANERQAVETYS